MNPSFYFHYLLYRQIVVKILKIIVTLDSLYLKVVTSPYIIFWQYWGHRNQTLYWKHYEYTTFIPCENFILYCSMSFYEQFILIFIEFFLSVLKYICTLKKWEKNILNNCTYELKVKSQTYKLMPKKHNRFLHKISVLK